MQTTVEGFIFFLLSSFFRIGDQAGFTTQFESGLILHQRAPDKASHFEPQQQFSAGK